MKSTTPWPVVAGTFLSLSLLVAAPAQQSAFEKKLKIDSAEVDRSGGIAKSYASVVEKVSPSVVSISTTKTTYRVRSNGFYAQRVPSQQTGLGSGVIVSADGYILTNNHVVGGADEVKVTLSGKKKEYIARVVGTDPSTDVAIIKIDAANDLPAAKLADSKKVKVGDVVLAFGTPFGLQQTVSMGIVSATGRANVGIVDYANFIQTDASINPGNSGGALVDADGRVIGINTAIYSETGGNMGIGFAIPINMAVAVVDSLFMDGQVTRGYLGVQMAPLNTELAEYLGRGDDLNGVVVARVEPGTPAAQAGFRSEDIITEFDGKPVSDYSRLRLKIAERKPGEKISFKIIRGGRERVLQAVLGKRPGVRGAVAPSRGELTEAKERELAAGVFVETLTARTRRALRLPEDFVGVVVSRLEESAPESNQRLEPGDIILEVDRKRVDSADEAMAISKEAKERILVRVLSGNEARLLVLQR